MLIRHLDTKKEPMSLSDTGFSLMGPPGLEPGTNGLWVRDSAYKSLVDNALQCVFEWKMRFTSSWQVNNSEIDKSVSTANWRTFWRTITQ